MSNLTHLFSPIRIGSMAVDNRLMVSAMGVGFGTDEYGVPTDQLIAFLSERARGRPGMMVTGASIVHPSGRISDVRPMRMIHLWDDGVMPALARMVEAIHRYDVKFGCQLNHGGLTMLPGPTFLPSAISRLTDLGLDIREPTPGDIRVFVEAFGAAAGRCVAAGFDFLEIHAGHGYLIHTFLDPYFNRRTDEYGGSLENRSRFLLEVIREVKRVAGEDIPIGIKLSADDAFENSRWGLEELCTLAPVLESAGVEYLGITCGSSNYGRGSAAAMIAPMYVPQGDRVRFAEAVKQHVTIPVATVGRIKDPLMADDVIRSGRADIVAMGRAFLADPDFAAKAREGNPADIRPCLADCLGCIDNILRYAESSCTVNPRVGREYQSTEIEGKKRADPKRVLVAGAGPAGLEAARRAAFSGHRVILCERRPETGGQLRLASAMPERKEIGDILPWYERQLNRYGVDVRLKTAVDEALLDEMRPDVMVAATGSLPLVPQGFVDGLENVEHIAPMMADALIAGTHSTVGAVLVIGGDQIGLQVADWLARAGKRIFVVERGNRLGEKMAEADRTYLLDRLKTCEALTIYRGVTRIEIRPIDDVWAIQNSRPVNLPGIDMIVFASDRRPDRFLAETALRKGIETHLAGDARGVMEAGMGTVMTAIATGYEVGRSI